MEPRGTAAVLSGVGTVVSGEASESDDEDVQFPLSLHPSLHGTVSSLSECCWLVSKFVNGWDFKVHENSQSQCASIDYSILLLSLLVIARTNRGLAVLVAKLLRYQLLIAFYFQAPCVPHLPPPPKKKLGSALHCLCLWHQEPWLWHCLDMMSDTAALEKSMTWG